jgi:signal transduction histidine kinase
MILASILLSWFQRWLAATGALVLFGGMAILEAMGVLAHWPLEGYAGEGLYEQPTYVFGTVFSLGAALYVVVYMSGSIGAQLRRREQVCWDAHALLAEKDRLKNQYVLRLTHDIRGHLSAIQSCLGIVRDGMLGDLNDRQTSMLERAHRRASVCMAFITALLRLTRMKLTGRLDMEWFPFAEVVTSAMATAESRAQQKGVWLDSDIDTDVQEVYGEPVLIEETITNMLLNSVKYTPGGGEVLVRVRREGKWVRVEIEDTGIGIPAGEEERIFEEFDRAPNARRIEREGTGLGLSIAREVVERHGGRIWAEGRPGVGSRFTFLLPKEPKKRRRKDDGEQEQQQEGKSEKAGDQGR